MESADIQKLSENLGKSLGLVTKALEGADVGKVSEQAEKLLTEMRATNQRIEQILKDIRLKPILTDASATLASVRRIVEQSEKPMNRIVASLTEASTSITDLSQKLAAFSRDLPESSAELKKILRRLENLISNQQQNIEVSIKNIKELTEKLNKRPSLLLFGKTPKEPAPVPLPETQR
jgi:DNA repair ATPase RecN